MNTPNATLIHSDCLAAMRAMPDNSVDLVLTDPPYGLGNTSPAQVRETVSAWLSGDTEYLPGGTGFMGKAWDAFVPPLAVWIEALRVLKPGGHVLAAAGSRTQDLMGLGMRLGGFELRDTIAWLYGSGFPKSMAVDKAIDKAAGATDAAKRWAGWGTALKPAYEPFIMARKPLDGTVAANVLAHGTGALNIDASRVGTSDTLARPAVVRENNVVYGKGLGAGVQEEPAGRWPANVILDAHQAAVLDEQSGIRKSGAVKAGTYENAADDIYYADRTRVVTRDIPASEGGASRFFQVIEPDSQFLYTPKAGKKDRPVVDGVAHPTVKPLALMRYLAKLACPPGGVILDPFAGSGTTAEAALLEGFDVIAIEREADYIPLIEARIARVQGTDELASAA